MIGRYDDYKGFVDLLPYTDDIADIHNDLKAASLVMMPSLSEGFGLSGYEAISAAVPVIVTFESGLAELLQTLIEKGKLDREIEEACIAPTQSDPSVVEVWSEKIGRVLADPEAAFARAERMRAALIPHLTWSAAATALTSALRQVLEQPASSPCQAAA